MGRIERALISVTDKNGITEFARELSLLGVEILSTGGTAKAIGQGGVPVVEVSEFTGFPEMLGGRVKTLHPRVHAGILYRRDDPDHVAQMAKNNLAPIDLVCVNLYAFAQAAAKPGIMLEEAIEEIDIGGPTLLRAAAKNFASVTVVVDPDDYMTVIEEMKANDGVTTLSTRFSLAKKVFALTHDYDGQIYHFLSGQAPLS